MCGIAGQVRLQDGPPADIDAVRLMTAAIVHRGPDDSGFYIDGESPAHDGPVREHLPPAPSRCVLGHGRLSIIDLTTGHQPLGNEDGSVQTVFNGEIYNFVELRTELEGKGHRFQTHTDTEVLVHLWEELGPAMANRLRGMFAFAIWDARTGQFFAARDPLGKKPFYYSALGGIFRFGSELKSLMADAGLPRRIDPQAIMLYLHMGYIPDPWSILQGVSKLPPGHWLLLNDGKIRVERYWRPPSRPTFTGTYDQAKSELRERVTVAVRRRLMADVPLGAFLSGGIDSTIVVGLMAAERRLQVRTFTIGFEESAYDESPFARLVSRRFGTDHFERIIQPDALEVLPLLAKQFDEPFADSSAIPTYYVSKFARERVTVALTGDGGDEAFGGYRRYRAGKIAGWLGRIPAGKASATLAGRLIPRSVDRTTNLGRARRVFERLGSSASDAYLAQMTQFSDVDLGRLLEPAFASRVDPNLTSHWFAGLYEGTDPADPSAASMSADLASYLPGDILTKVDRASMAVSLECRSPLLDRDVVEFAASLPTSWRLKGLAGHKHILKETFADLLPPEIVNRGKTGFAVPLPHWFRGPLKGLLTDTLLSSGARSRGFCKSTEVERLVAEHQSGRNHSASLWTLLMLELWQKEWGI